MNRWIAILAVAIAVALAAVIYALSCRRRMKRLLLRLEEMLDAAMDGTYKEELYDESLLSSIEARLGRYLSACALSAQKLSQEEERIKALIGDISHQTKTPLANLLLYGQLLKEQPLDEKSASLVRELNTQGEKLSFLIGALVKVSRLETGVISLSPKEGPIQPVLDQVQNQALPRALEKGIELSLAKSPHTALFDQKWTAEALYNIVDNGIKYTPAGGRVSISATAYDMFLRIDVTDTGIGIPEPEQSRVFGRFYRGAQVREQEGLGIGLYLARQIITGQGGYIKLSSAPGRGSTFSVFLPILSKP